MAARLKKEEQMGKKTALLGLFICGLILTWASCAFAAYSLDGYLSDWGVTPFTDWTPWDSRVDWVEEDHYARWYPAYIGHGAMPIGGEPNDIEAFYFDDDPSFVYFALVTSYPFHRAGSGDIAIGFGAAGYEYGIKVRGLDVYGHNFVSLKQLRPGEDWTYGAIPSRGPVYLAAGVGEDIGLAEIYYWNATYMLGPYNEPGTLNHTWVMEGRMNRLLFDGLASQGNIMRLHNSMECSNDYLDLKGDFDTPRIPEPATLALISLGMLGFGVVRKKRG